MRDLVRERTENPINRQQSMEANFNNSLTSTTHVISQLPQYSPAHTARATTHPIADASRTRTTRMQATGAGGGGKARTGRAGDRDGHTGGAGEDGGRETEDPDAMGVGRTTEVGSCGDAAEN